MNLQALRIQLITVRNSPLDLSIIKHSLSQRFEAVATAWLPYVVIMCYSAHSFGADRHANNLRVLVRGQTRKPINIHGVLILASKTYSAAEVAGRRMELYSRLSRWTSS